ncbi:MAG: hypothetical protein M5U18_02905 [Dehalococcoidia bacterium]|nr:hypothetical protein [Dehalococcoidia bacterium]
MAAVEAIDCLDEAQGAMPDKVVEVEARGRVRDVHLTDCVADERKVLFDEPVAFFGR